MHINRLNPGDQVEATFGQQIRNYVFAPYKMVKDTRTGYETAQVTATATPHTMSIMLLSVTSTSLSEDCDLSTARILICDDTITTASC